MNKDPSAKEQESVEIFCRTMAKAMSAESVKDQPIHTINLVALFFRIVENLKYIVLCAVLFGIIGGCYSTYFTTPTYSATAKLYILGQTDSSVNLNSLQIGTVLTMDYQEVFKTWEVSEMVRNELNLNYNYGQLQSMLTVKNPEDTRVLYITIVNTDPQLAIDIANAYAKAVQTFVSENLDSESPISFSSATSNGRANYIGRSSYIAIGFIFGMLASIVIVALRFVFDDRPMSPEDVEESSGLATFAVIPSMKTSPSSDKGKNQ